MHIQQAWYVWASWSAIGHIWQSCCIFKRFVARWWTSVVYVLFLNLFGLFLLETICVFHKRICLSLPSPWYILCLTEEMKVQLQLYDGRALSASLPKHVTCTIEETQLPMKGLTSAPRYVFFFKIRNTYFAFLGICLFTYWFTHVLFSFPNIANQPYISYEKTP